MQTWREIVEKTIRSKDAHVICFYGGVGTQQTLRFGRPEDVRKEVAELKHCPDGTGFILAPTLQLMEDIPMENVLALLRRPVVIDRSAMRRNLLDLGVRQNGRYIIHSSFKAIGPVDGGPAAFLADLLAIVGEHGVVMMPAFNEPQQIFDSARVPTDCGVLAEMFRTMEGTFRSFHPTHSVTVRGPGARDLAQLHATASALGVGSPMHALIEQGAEILLLGVDQNRNSSVHIAEAICGAPYLPIPFDERFARPMLVLRDGKKELFIVRECPGCSENFGVLNERLKRAGIVRTGLVGNALTKLINGRDFIRCVVEVLREDTTALLCANPKCGFCPKAREAARSREPLAVV
ncbi:MAG: AAC(3) family N-acetyltransferase [Verrucomicrobiota bacterium]